MLNPKIIAHAHIREEFFLITMADDEDIPTEEEFSFKLSYDEDEELIESLTQAQDNGKLDSHLKNLLRLGHSVYSGSDFPN